MSDKNSEKDTERLEWLIYQSDPFEIFGNPIPQWCEGQDLLNNWRKAIDDRINKSKAK